MSNEITSNTAIDKKQTKQEVEALNKAKAIEMALQDTTQNKITGSRAYKNPLDHNAFSLIRLNNYQIGRLGLRNDWLTITANKDNPKKKRVIYRQMAGYKIDKNNRLPEDLEFNKCEFDYEALLDLGIKGGKKDGYYSACDLHIEKTRWLRELFMAHWCHPHTNHRAPMQIALIGLALGVIGVIFGVVSLFPEHQLAASFIAIGVMATILVFLQIALLFRHKKKWSFNYWKNLKPTLEANWNSLVQLLLGIKKNNV